LQENKFLKAAIGDLSDNNANQNPKPKGSVKNLLSELLTGFGGRAATLNLEK
jgi:hypothetical protein